MSPRYPEIGAAIRKARRRRGLTQDELAQRVGAKGARFTVIKWEQGLHKPTEYAKALVEVLGLPEDLFDDEDEEEAAWPGRREADFLEALKPLVRLLTQEQNA